VAQEVEYLLCKYEALSSNSSATKKRKKETKSSANKSPFQSFSWLKVKKLQGPTYSWKVFYCRRGL
jgi:hypothetical protein